MKEEKGNPDRVDRDAQAREEERVHREREAIAEISGSPAAEDKEEE